MLPKLRVGRGAIYFQDESLKVGHDGQITKGEKVGSIKDFGADPYIWNESFDNYISICVEMTCHPCILLSYCI
jgi:hypothetical protein